VGESVAPILAKKDKLIFGEEYQPYELYSNQYIPLIANASMADRIKLTGKFMHIVSGGGILHLNISDRIKNAEQMKKLLLFALKNGVEHLAVNYGFGICENDHTSIVGNSMVCPVCGGKVTDHLTRIIGYFTKVSSWNSVRRDFEFPRRDFKIPINIDLLEDDKLLKANEIPPHILEVTTTE